MHPDNDKRGLLQPCKRSAQPPLPLQLQLKQGRAQELHESCLWTFLPGALPGTISSRQQARQRQRGPQKSEAAAKGSFLTECALPMPGKNSREDSFQLDSLADDSGDPKSLALFALRRADSVKATKLCFRGTKHLSSHCSFEAFKWKHESNKPLDVVKSGMPKLAAVFTQIAWREDPPWPAPPHPGQRCHPWTS